MSARKKFKNARMIIGETGHRTLRLMQAGFSIEKLKAILTDMLTVKYKATAGISGMALGFDMAFADVCIMNNIPLIAAVPYIGQEKRWPIKDQWHYQSILSWSGTRMVVVSKGGYAAWKLFMRNKWVVDNCELLISGFDGIKAGGTWDCLQYAEKTGRVVDPVDLKMAI
jgi:uncharacterized phage-like protein YoqJ